MLDRLIRAHLDHGVREILHCACGIGMQAIGLAQRGHRVTACDLSPAAARRASREALARHLPIPTAAADMRHLPFSSAAFDVVVCADNAIAHLLSRDELTAAFVEMHRVLRPTGLVLVGTRSDFASNNRPIAGPVQVSRTPEGPVLTFQLWEWHPDGSHYDLQHIQLKPDGGTYTVRVRRTTSWALSRAEITDVARQAGYSSLRWHASEDTGFSQPILACRPG